jgi:pyruvate/2-oxoglutarate dehydrogenase complex dihydrolipoamide dehydrogenase (E3) component
MLDQVMAPLDFEMAQLLHEQLEQNGVRLHLGDGVSSFTDGAKEVTVALKSGETVSAELVILSIGVRPTASSPGPPGSRSTRAAAWL